MNRTSIKVSLAGKGSEGRGWLPEGETGELSVEAINTGAGRFEFEKVRANFHFSSRDVGVVILID